MSTDALGQAVTLDHAASLAPLNDFVEGFIASEARAANILQAQQDGSAIVQAYCAALHMFAETGEAAGNARPFIERARRGPGRRAIGSSASSPPCRRGSKTTCPARSRCWKNTCGFFRATWWP